MALPATSPWLSETAIATAQQILSSHRMAFGLPLIASLPADATPTQWAQALFASDRVVLSHDGADPGGNPGPRLIYANRAALRLWRRPWAEMVGMPSRLTAEPASRRERAQALRQVQVQQAIRHYGGVRIDSRGRRFRISGARVWTLCGSEQSGNLEPSGQAAGFADWWWLA